jgi:hypothetical protein
VFNLPAAGSYKVWARVIAPSTDHDSFWVRMDGGAFVKWNNIAAGGAWHWDFLRNADAGNALVTFALPAGTHTLQFAYREGGTRLDKVLLTSDPNLIPSGLGP